MTKNSFKIVYVELTDICGLSCDFCPSQSGSTTITPEAFERISSQLTTLTKEVAYHVVGDPMVLSNLRDYLDISHRHHHKVHITTSGFYPQHLHQLLHPAVKQVNFSLHSFDANRPKISLDEYLAPLVAFAKQKNAQGYEFFVNFRLWNEGSGVDNTPMIQALYDAFGVDGGKRLAPKVLIATDTRFEWPSLNNEVVGQAGSCYGLKAQFAILSSGVVVPCCLDYQGVINLGSSEDIQGALHSPLSLAIKEGFATDKLLHELCQKCTFRQHSL